MSEVFLCKDLYLDKKWAIKVISSKKGINNLNFAKKEAKLISKLDHPYLPRIVEIINDKERVFVVMDYIEGASLEKILIKQGPLSKEAVIDILFRLSDVLMYLHTRKPAVIHRDIKPGNIILTKEGNIKLIDFGIAGEHQRDHSYKNNNHGTKGYAAPEQYDSRYKIDERADIYSMGVTALSLITGKNPEKSLHSLLLKNTKSSDFGGLESIIIKCIYKNPNKRYKNINELRFALSHIKEQDIKYIKGLKRKLFLYLILVFIFISLLISGIFFLYSYFSSKKNLYDSNLFIHSYENAINIDPGNTKAYTSFIEEIKGDEIFDLSEEEALIKEINKNINTIKKNSEYGILLFDIGRLYFFYYDYGGSTENITGIKNSYRYFKEASDYLEPESKETKENQILLSVSEFYSNIAINQNEGKDEGLYRELFNNLQDLLYMMGKDENDYLKLITIDLYLGTVNSYIKNFKTEGISYENIKDSYFFVLQLLKSINAKQEKTVDIKTEILKSIHFTKEMIDSIYGKEII